MISRLHISALLFVAASVWGVALIFAGVQMTAAWFKPFSIVVGVLVLVLSVADKWLWRLRWLRPWLFNMPDLRGTWKVTIHPTAPTTSPTEVIAYMVIRQTLSTISLRLFTPESQSETLSARVVRCDDGTCNVAGVYRNIPRLQVRDHSPLHHGALLLSVQGDPPRSLAGQYWTDRLSQGELTLSAKTSTLAHSFEEGQTLTAASVQGADQLAARHAAATSGEPSHGD